MRHRAMALEPFSARIAALEALCGAIDPLKASSAPLRDAADKLDATAPVYEHSATAVGYTALAELLRICAQLVEWRAAVLDASPEAERFVRAAMERYRIWTTEFEGKQAAQSLLTASSAVSRITSVQEVGPLLGAVSMVPICIRCAPNLSRAMPPAYSESSIPYGTKLPSAMTSSRKKPVAVPTSRIGPELTNRRNSRRRRAKVSRFILAVIWFSLRFMSHGV